MLDREEYVEQTYFFRTLAERMSENVPMQELLQQAKDEILATTKLPLAIDFLLSELKHLGTIGSAMVQLPHYFAPFQVYIANEAENERGRFDMRVAVEILRSEADYRSRDPVPAGLFMFQLETLCRNRLSYDRGLTAMAADPVYDEPWKAWIIDVRRQMGLLELADMIYVRSAYYQQRLRQRPAAATTPLFGEKEGKIAWANRRKDPLYLFAALQRHLGYPAVPRLKPVDRTAELVPQLMRRMERLEVRLKLLEEESRDEAIDITKFYEPPPQ